MTQWGPSTNAQGIILIGPDGKTPISLTNALPVQVTNTNPNGQAASNQSQPVVLASDQSAIPVTSAPSPSSTGTKTNVASSASSVTILAANTSRKGFIIYNDSTQILYLDLSGGTSSSSSYSQQLVSGGSFVALPTNYVGAISGIWAAANGNARVTEFT